MTSDEKFELLLKLQKIDDKVMKTINEKCKRRRLINIIYLIQKIYDYQNKLEEINKKYNLEMTSDEKFKFLMKFQIDKVIKTINEKWEIIRLINIKYLIKTIYHYQNKIEEINKEYNLEMTSDVKFELLLILQMVKVIKNN